MPKLSLGEWVLLMIAISIAIIAAIAAFMLLGKVFFADKFYEIFISGILNFIFLGMLYFLFNRS
ncbi:MAG: hypothetical protein LLG02_12870 [Pelosinus sp.]|nr:hypothetical protein [Pelosinus sp.]